MRCCTSPDYPKLTVHVFALGHYIPMSEGEDEFSKKINNFYLYDNKDEKIIELVLDLFQTHFTGDSISYDLVTLVPTSQQGKVRDSMLTLVNELCQKYNLVYRQILVRNRDVKKSHEITTAKERLDNGKGSVSVTEVVDGKTILVLDNISTTGYTCLEILDTLLTKGAKQVIFLCLGIGIRGKEHDYYLDRDKKVSWLIEKFKTAKISKEDRERWKAKTRDLHE